MKNPMSQQPVSEQERALLQTLSRLTKERDERETTLEREYRSERAAADRRIEEALRRIRSAFETEKSRAEEEHRTAVQETESRYSHELERATAQYEAKRFKIREQADHDENAAKRKWDEARWTAETVFEAKESQPRERFEKIARNLVQKYKRMQAMESDAGALLHRYRLRGIVQHLTAGEDSPADGGQPDSDPQAELEREVTRASEALGRLRTLRLAKLFSGMLPFILLLLPLVGSAAILGWLTEWRFAQPDVIDILAASAVFAVAVAILVLFYLLARKRAVEILSTMQGALARARSARERSLMIASEERAREEAELKRQHDADIDRAREKYGPRIQRVRLLRSKLLGELDEKYEQIRARLKKRRETDLAEIEERFAKRKAEVLERFERDESQARCEYERRSRNLEDTHRADWNDLESKWKSGMAEVAASVARINAIDEKFFPSWDDSTWADWSPPASFAPAIRFGRLDVDLETFPGGVPKDERLLDVGPMQFSLPAFLDFPVRSSLLFAAHDAFRDTAVATLQTVMLRLLTLFPPGKVRFTIIDPVGLGQNFAGFMHLADYEEAFVSDRIWTETRHIEQRLLDLTEHMENVIQKYLRNDFETITEYNRHAGEIAEPFRFLVIANFPVNFSETAARRLVSIVESGPRCGVYTLISMDARQPMPRDFQPEDLRKNGVTLLGENDQVVIDDDDFRALPLALDSPPANEFLTGVIHRVGESARDATRVEVPFEHVVPSNEHYWTATSAEDVVVPLGRAGATKLQPMTLGRGIAQHMLIAGKTGSGKSTLLHVLITNLALHYHPQEVEFYLVDFKKGVEFKTYATHNLPHARAVAIESDREFGLSVLQRVDAELKRRGELFRGLGVQDLPQYRRTGHPQSVPRTLLIIDEFQEFFVEDDKIAQDAALLLDRLVRQGRAFGIHVILGSQTLAGAYSLARSTIGQMAVRVALQCSEADAMLIMSDDNTAARLLSRPGEAIYNDQSGRVEGNSPFQIVWLPEHVREKHLLEIDRLADAADYEAPEPQIVFEGNAPADISRNQLLRRAMEGEPAVPIRGRGRPARGRARGPLAAPAAWLGEAIAIKDPTAAIFRRQSGTNLLMIGQRDEAALGIAAASLVSLASQCSFRPPADAKFYIFDGLPADSPHAGYFQTVARSLPHDVQVVAWRDVEAAIAEIAQELDSRDSGDLTDTPPIFLLIYGLQRFRMLRQEEEFGFSSLSGGETEATAAKHFVNILRGGPPCGMHTIVWCDTANNLNRTIDRKTLREFDMRVLFQMSSTDSSNLIDSPAASLLGTQRAIYFSEDHGILEKFRPYGLPDEEWLKSVSQQLQGASADMT